MRSRGMRRGVPLVAAVLAVCLLGVSAAPASARHHGVESTTDWPAYLHDTAHSSVSGDNAIDASNAASLIERWRWMAPPRTVSGQPSNQLFSSPTVVGTTVYIGSNTGWFYALDTASGQVLWKYFTGYVTALTCQAKGIVSTATVAADPTTGAPTVYVSGGNGYLYALDAATGGLVWQSVIGLPSSTANDYYDWSSPTVANGDVYVGISSQCDNPLVQGGVRAYDQATGTPLATFYAVPSGQIGGSVWSSVAATPTAVYATTGNGPPTGTDNYDAVSILKLDPSTLALQGQFSAPLLRPNGDQDFGASPVVFTATVGNHPTTMVGASNKNGVFYALDTSNMATPVWSDVIDNPVTPTIPAGVWDGSRLFVAGNTTTINGVTYHGSIRDLDPSTGAVVWATGLPGAVLGTPSLNGAGLLAVSTYDSTGGVPIQGAPNATFLIDAATGTIVSSLTVNHDVQFAQPVFAGPDLLLATRDEGLNVLTPSATTFSDGFESGDLSSWTRSKGVTVESSQVDTGTYAAQATPASTSAFLTKSIGPTGDLTVHLRFMVQSQGSRMGLLAFRDGAGKNLLAVSVSASGKLAARAGTGATVASSTLVSGGVWHALDVHVIDSATGQYSVRLDGAVIDHLSVPFAFSANPIQKITLGDTNTARTFQVDFDNVAFMQPAS